MTRLDAGWEGAVHTTLLAGLVRDSSCAALLIAIPVTCIAIVGVVLMVIAANGRHPDRRDRE
jgi:hypothetical protein